MKAAGRVVGTEGRGKEEKKRKKKRTSSGSLALWKKKRYDDQLIQAVIG